MILSNYTVWITSDYREFCDYFDFECDESLIGELDDQTLIENILRELPTKYIVEYIESGDFFLIIDLGEE